MSKHEIDASFDEIVDFAGVEQFLDTPVKRYSSGMRVRLAFSVAAHLRVDIMLIDEVLAVGDAEFQRKCLGKMGDVASEGRTILFVSHNMAAITTLCSRAVLLNDGKIDVDGTPNQAISAYLHKAIPKNHTLSWDAGYSELGVDDLKIHYVQVRNHEADVSYSLDVRYPFDIEIMYEVFLPISRGRLTIQISNSEGVMILHGYDIDSPDIRAMRTPGRYLITCHIPGHLLRPGTYYLRIGADDQNIKVLAFPEDQLEFHIIDTGSVGSHVSGRRLGIIEPYLDWTQRELTGVRHGNE
jgi:lipopolysaccharide transport system ATP-binding protein